MTEREEEQDFQISKRNISYYDEIAENYDAILTNDGSNKIIREIVAEKFSSIVRKGGCVLDFGGGTGGDLEWLIQQHYQVIFCEPSPAMRKIAVNRVKKEFHEAIISFFDDNKSDFRNWNTIFPFDLKVDAVIANFAVINCIPDLQFLFEKLALAIKPGGIILALLLDNRLLVRLRSNMKGTIKSLFTRKTITIHVDYNGKRQIVFIHTAGKIRNAAKNQFEFIRIERLHQFGFCLIHLRRK
jgi:SAM-dependent methyltransferase